MRNQTLFMRIVALLLTVTMSMLPIHTYATDGQNPDISSVGKEAQTFGQGLANSFRANSGSVQNGTILMPTLKDGQFQMNGGSQINVNDLFPGTSGGDGQPDSYYFPDANKPDVDMLQGIMIPATIWTTWATAPRGLFGPTRIAPIHPSQALPTKYSSMQLTAHVQISVRTRY